MGQRSFTEPPPDDYYIKGDALQYDLITRRVVPVWRVIRREDNELMAIFRDPARAEHFRLQLDRGEIIP